MDAISMLKQAAKASIREKYPSVPDYAIVVRKYSDRSANGLTRCILDWLRFNGHQAERINCTGCMIDNRQTVIDVVGRVRTVGTIEWVPGTGTNGTADISAIIHGRSVKIEIKVGRDRQSDHQRHYQEQVVKAGGTYIMARNFAGFVQWYKQVIMDTGGKLHGRRMD